MPRKTGESLNNGYLDNDEQMAKNRKKDKKFMFWLIVVVGLIYGAIFGYFLGRFTNQSRIYLYLLLFMIMGILIGVGFALSTKK